MSDNLKIQGEVTLDATNADAAFGRVEAGARRMANAVKESGQQADKAITEVGNGAPQATEKMNRATGAFVANIQRLTAAEKTLADGGKNSVAYLEERARQLGLSASAYQPYIRELEAARAANAALDKSVVNVGMSAKATAAALRGVPAQFTDFVTSIQGGQAPLTVFLQQGGQLKDMFGGAGNAAKALGGYILGLVNPYTLAAAAIVTLGVAYYQGGKEAEGYNRALILSGNVAGQTASQLTDMARAIGDTTKITQGSAAEAITAFVSAGVSAGSQLQKYAVDAINFERASGQAVGKTADAFKDLEKAPLTAVLKLNDSLHFLNVTTYEQIKALEEQGKMTDAARVAQDAYANTIGTRAKQITENLGGLETSWRAITSVAAKAWDAMLGVNRDLTGSEQLAKLKKTLAEREASGPIGSALFSNADYEAGNKVLRDQIALIERLNGAQQQTAQNDAKQQKLLDLKIAYDKQADQVETNAEKRRKAIEKATVDGQILINAGLLSEKDLRTQLANIAEKYKDKATPSGAAGPGQTEIASIQARNAGDMGGCEDQWLLWISPGSSVSNGLMRRRRAELALFRG